MYKRWTWLGLLLAGLGTLIAPWPTVQAAYCDLRAPEAEQPHHPPLPADLRCGPRQPSTPEPEPPPRPRGYTGLTNPAVGQVLPPVNADPLGAFSRRPLEHFIIPEGGLFLDPQRDGQPHYGVDYANPEDYLLSQPTYFYPIGPGYVTARSSCLLCFVEGDKYGRVEERLPRHNFGFGGIVVVETPYNSGVSIYVMYAHLARDFASLGDYVTPEEPLGVVGSTGYSEMSHLHMEIRYGTPGRFWNADFSQWATLDRWLSTMFVNPAWLVFPEHHPTLVQALDNWVGLLPQSPELP